MKTKEEIQAIHDLSNKDIAKQLRKDLKEAYPDFKFSVTSDIHSIDINIMEGTIDFYTKDYTEAYEAKEWDKLREIKEEHRPLQGIYTYYTMAGEKILKRVEEIRNLYNHDNSDAMTDYFDVNYYGGVEIGKWNKKYINKAA